MYRVDRVDEGRFRLVIPRGRALGGRSCCSGLADGVIQENSPGSHGVVRAIALSDRWR